ncbi:hypothetical protein [Halolamina salifodinae]|uniref:Uncharacterized protein n=1 Tax=Halolamina salifodinae TaxID=1202767 RepID=A0A8T4GYP5_9EURY|nr:hypothetical protein [Halolamina salifodinae]MBP1987382.1 hypothetical protein [Halolamina salifodinae]
MTYQCKLNLIERNASVADGLSGSDVGGKGTVFLEDDQLVFGSSRTGGVEAFVGDTLDSALFGLPSRLGLYDPFSVSRSEADRYDDTTYLNWAEIEGVCALKHGSGSSVFVESSDLEPGQRYQFVLEPKAEHSGFVSTGAVGTHAEFAEELLRRAESAEVIDVQSDITGSTELLDISP